MDFNLKLNELTRYIMLDLKGFQLEIERENIRITLDFNGLK